MERQRAIELTLMGAAGLLAVAVIGLALWPLLSHLGDERGAAAAQYVAAGAGLGVGLLQILLLNLLALTVLRGKIEHPS